MTKSISSRSEATIERPTTYLSRKFYFITIRKHQVKDYVDVQDILNILGYLNDKLKTLKVFDNCFEVDKKYRQLHFHAIISTNEYFKYKTLSTYGGFRIYWKPIYNYKKLQSYIIKDCNSELWRKEEIISNNFYTHPKAPYRFI